MSPPIIRTRGLTKRFGDFTAVSDLSIEVMPGTIFAFLGANGSGKSTTIRMLIGLLRPSAGTVEVDGIDVIRRPRRVRDHIGYMGQKVSLYQGLTLRENVEFYAGLYGLAGGALGERWGALRERFALGEAEREKPEDLPAGIRQRAGLALATLHRPRVLFLDEPTAGVDVRSRGLFWDLIQDEAGAGVTVFVTTHFLEEVEYCDWAAFIDAGRLIANATPEALRQRYSDGYRVDVAVPDAGRSAAAATLGPVGETAATPEGFTLRVPALDPPVLAALDRALVSGRASVAMVIPPDFDRALRREAVGARPPEIQLLYDGGEAVLAGNAEGFLRAQLAHAGATLTATNVARDPATDRQAGVDVVAPALFNPTLDGTRFMVSGTFGFVLSFLTTLITAVSIVNERLTGTFDQLQVTPATSLEIFLGKILPLGAVFAFDVVLMAVVAGVFLGVWPDGNMVFFLVVSAFYVLVSLALGLLISATSATAAEAVQKTVVFS